MSIGPRYLLEPVHQIEPHCRGGYRLHEQSVVQPGSGERRRQRHIAPQAIGEQPTALLRPLQGGHILFPKNEFHKVHLLHGPKRPEHCSEPAYSGLRGQKSCHTSCRQISIDPQPRPRSKRFSLPRASCRSNYFAAIFRKNLLDTFLIKRVLSYSSSLDRCDRSFHITQDIYIFLPYPIIRSRRSLQQVFWSVVGDEVQQWIVLQRLGTRPLVFHNSNTVRLIALFQKSFPEQQSTQFSGLYISSRRIIVSIYDTVNCA